MNRVGEHVQKPASAAPMRDVASSAAAAPMAFPAEFQLLRRSLGDDAASPALTGSLREAGFHMGETLYTRFGDWLSLRGDSVPEQLSEDAFATLVGEFFEVYGWGHISIAPLTEGIMVLDATDWCEARAGGKHCLVSTGVFSGFFGRFADAPIAVMEVECSASGHPHCRFLLSAEQTLRRVHDAMLRGVTYANATRQE